MYLVQFKHQTTNLQYKSVIVVRDISKLKHQSLDLDFRLKCASYILSGKLIYILCSPGDSFGSEINEIGNINSFFLSSQLCFCTYPKHIMVLFIGAQVYLPPCKHSRTNLMPYSLSSLLSTRNFLLYYLSDHVK